MQIGWQFPRNYGGQSQGFRDGAIDTFSGRRLSGLVREVIQNSLDAHDENSGGPVTVEFSLVDLPAADLDDLTELERHISRCSETAEKLEHEDIKEFHDHASSLIKGKGSIPVLIISDSNTCGLTGPIDDQYGAWFALTKGTGITQKQGSGSLGSYGHGSKAPFAMSSIRTVYYLTKTITESNVVQMRFQGKSILQSHRHPADDEITQGVGYFGFKDGLSPLLDEDVPRWATTLRSRHSENNGTTIFIPFTRFRSDLFPETEITVVANFYYAIKRDLLKVIVNKEVIDYNNIDHVFHRCEQALPDERDEIDVNHTKECFESIRTIIDCTDRGSNEINYFGRIDWFLRVRDDVTDKKVAISRESGMLITKRAPKLIRFPSTKPFDMFVFVNSGEGSSVLKRLENPSHDNFEFDRVADSEDSKKIQSRYNKFTGKIRDILKNYASVESDDEVKLTELSKLMFDLGTSDDRNNNIERGTSMYIANGAPPRIILGKKGDAVPGGNISANGIAQGNKKGKGGKRKESGAITGAGGREVSISGGSKNITLSSAKRQVSNLRMIPIRGKDGYAKISFSASLDGEFSFQLMKAGETESNVIPLLVNNQPVSSLRINILGQGRKTITVRFEHVNDMNFALEGWLDALQ